eukprot:358487-Chlamydomonas_euryale.AAC.15
MQHRHEPMHSAQHSPNSGQRAVCDERSRQNFVWVLTEEQQRARSSGQREPARARAPACSLHRAPVLCVGHDAYTPPPSSGRKADAQRWQATGIRSFRRRRRAQAQTARHGRRGYRRTAEKAGRIGEERRAASRVCGPLPSVASAAAPPICLLYAPGHVGDAAPRPCCRRNARMCGGGAAVQSRGHPAAGDRVGAPVLRW